MQNNNRFKVEKDEKDKKKKLLLLGGSGYLIPVIEKAKELGIFTITCDNIPDNVAHKYSDMALNISIVEKDKVLDEAKKIHVDGIISFACDPGVTTAAYVAEKMNLQFQGSYESVSILQDKEKFRKFLFDNGFNVPLCVAGTTSDELLLKAKDFKWPLIIKPADSAGSKGVKKVSTKEELENAFDYAMKYSICKKVIAEEYLEFEGEHSSADYFTIEGKLVFSSFSDQLFDKKASNPYTPSFIIWPSSMKKEYQDELNSEIQRLMSLLNMGTGIYNIETCVSNGKGYIMEVSPRGGGCRIAEIQEMSMGAKLIENEIRASVKMPLVPISKTSLEGYWVEMIVHSDSLQSGELKEIEIDRDIEKKNIRYKHLLVKPGDIVPAFTGANATLGDIFLHFENKYVMDDILFSNREWLKIKCVE